jgi:hypothetical protein
MRKVVFLAIATTLIASACGGGSMKPAASGSSESSGSRYRWHDGAAVITLQLLPAGTRNRLVAKVEACRRAAHGRPFGSYVLATIDDRNGTNVVNIFRYKIVTTSGRTIFLSIVTDHFGPWRYHSKALTVRCEDKLYASLFNKDAAGPGQRAVAVFIAPVRIPAIKYVFAKPYGPVRPKRMKRVG